MTLMMGREQGEVRYSYGVWNGRVTRSAYKLDPVRGASRGKWRAWDETTQKWCVPVSRLHKLRTEEEVLNRARGAVSAAKRRLDDALRHLGDL